MRTRREKVTGRVLALDRSLEDALPYLYGLLGLVDEKNQVAEIEAQTRKRRSLDAIKRILLLVNPRPEYRHEWGHKTYYTQLRLDPLGKESADEMLGRLLGDGVELGPLKRLIIERTEGNPFFMEETVQVRRNSLARGDSIRRHAAEQPIPQDQRVKQNCSKMGDEREE